MQIVPGKLELSHDAEGAVWFTPIGDAAGKRIRLDKQFAQRLISVHPERQALFNGCTHILELSSDELDSFGREIEAYIERPLLSPHAFVSVV